MRNKMRNAECGMRKESARPISRSSFILHPSSFSSAFSLVEVLAAIAIIGIVTYLAIPNIVRIKRDGEDNLARARAETLNLAIATYVMARGTNAAQTNWAGRSDAYRYTNCLAQYISFAEASFTSFQPLGYSLTLPTNISPLSGKTLASNTNLGVSVDY